MPRSSQTRVVLGSIVSLALIIGVAVWAWGDARGFFSHPARVLACVATVAMTIVGLRAGANFSAGRRWDARDVWIFVPTFVFGFALLWVSPYCDARDLWTIDGDAARYAGLALFLAGGTLRCWAVVVLGRRFSGLVAIQKDHQLVTTGVYGLIRHPSYLGAIAWLAGWALLFRSGIGLLLALAIVPPIIVARMNHEEAFLLSEFGESYARYRRRTWRLLPWVY